MTDDTGKQFWRQCGKWQP